MKSDITPLLANRFVADNLQANLLTQVRGSPPVVSSSYCYYTAFGEWRKARPSPSTEERTPMWNCVFTDQPHMGTISPLLAKVYFFLRFSALG